MLLLAQMALGKNTLAASAMVAGVAAAAALLTALLGWARAHGHVAVQWWRSEMRPDERANAFAGADMLRRAPAPVRVAPLVLTLEDLSFAAGAELGTELMLTLNEVRNDVSHKGWLP